MRDDDRGEQAGKHTATDDTPQMSSTHSNVELLDIVNDDHMHSDAEVQTAIDLLEARGVYSGEVADRKRGAV